MFSNGVDGGTETGRMFPALVSHFPDPICDEQSSKKAFETLMQRLHHRAMLRTRIVRVAVATGAAVLAGATWVVL